MSNSSSLATTTESRYGWTSSPNGRGTMTIVWSCAITTFLCCWSVLITNLPEPGSNRWSILIRKLCLLGLCAAAPEIVFQVALGQWLSAYDSMKLFRSSGYEDWTLRHSFFVDMGAYHLKGPDFKQFPINSRQLHYLVKKNYVACPEINENQIRDRNKVDGTLRFITLIQTLCFMTSLVLRAIQNLGITALELSTSAFVVLSVMTTIFWLKKPADVEECEIIETETQIATILADANVPIDTPYTYTPLDFVGREEWPWSILWMHGLNCLRRLHLAGQPQELPVQRFQNSLVPVIRGWYLTLFAVFSLIYLSIFVAGWNFSFPTAIEQTLWRVASLTALVTASATFICQHLGFRCFPPLHRNMCRARSSSEPEEGTAVKQNIYVKKVIDSIRPIQARYDAAIDTIHNNSISKDPALDAPVGIVLITWLFGYLYVCARGYIFIADLIELRSLPSDVYDTLNWSALSPYIP